jgi:plasmid stability protein
MDTTIRNLDDRAYRSLRAQAALEGRTVGELISEAIRRYLAGTAVQRPRSSLRALRPEPFPAGNERLSEEIDSVVYGPRR